MAFLRQKKTQNKTLMTFKCLLKSRMRETSNLSTDADSSAITTVGWTKNTQIPKKKLKRKKIIQKGKTQNM